MTQDQSGKIWKNNQMVGYVEDGQLFGINPHTGYRQKIESYEGKDAIGTLKRWLKLFST